MNYLKFGTGKKYLVFLHGWGADLNSFLWLKDYFVEDYSMLFVDFAGFGKSETPHVAYFVSDYVCELKKLLNKFDIKNLVLIGHSFGGRVAIKFAFLFSKEYKNLSLLLVDSAGILPKRTLGYYLKVWRYKSLKRQVLSGKKSKEVLEKFGSKDYKDLAVVMRQTFVNVVNEDLSEYAKRLSVKTLIVWGENDKDTKPYMAKKLNRLIAGSKLVFLKDAGHFSFLDKKEDFVIILDTFLKNI